MSLSGLVLKSLFVIGVGALGVEFGRRHPDDPWQAMWDILKDKSRKVKDNADQAVNTDDSVIEAEVVEPEANG